MECFSILQAVIQRGDAVQFSLVLLQTTILRNIGKVGECIILVSHIPQGHPWNTLVVECSSQVLIILV